MVRIALIAATLVAAALATPAQANVCKAENLTCATRMPVGGYCECTAKGQTTSGEVAAGPMSKKPMNAKAGGCGAQPNAPGCH